MGVSLTGAAIVIAFVLSQREVRTFAVGDLYLLGTVVAGAFGYALSGRLSMSMPGWEVVSWQVTAFLPFSTIMAFLLGPTTFRRTTGCLGRPRLCQLRSVSSSHSLC